MHQQIPGDNNAYFNDHCTNCAHQKDFKQFIQHVELNTVELVLCGLVCQMLKSLPQDQYLMGYSFPFSIQFPISFQQTQQHIYELIHSNLLHSLLFNSSESQTTSFFFSLFFPSEQLLFRCLWQLFFLSFITAIFFFLHVGHFQT